MGTIYYHISYAYSVAKYYHQDKLVKRILVTYKVLIAFLFSHIFTTHVLNI